MSLIFILFYSLFFLLILSSIGVVFASNPVHSIFFLVCVFLNVSAFFLFLNVEFIAIIFLIIYVGAIAVLFLFVVMMLNIKAIEYQQTFFRYVPISSLLCLTFLIQITYVLYFVFYTDQSLVLNGNFFLNEYLSWFDLVFFIENTKLLGTYLFNFYFLAFLISGLILLLSMIASIVLTLTKEQQTKRQEIFKQLLRSHQKTIFLKKK